MQMLLDELKHLLRRLRGRLGHGGIIKRYSATAPLPPHLAVG
jgi:hypothetical protein